MQRLIKVKTVGIGSTISRAVMAKEMWDVEVGMEHQSGCWNGQVEWMKCCFLFSLMSAIYIQTHDDSRAMTWSNSN